MSLDANQIERLRALPYAERHPRMTFRGESHFAACHPCGELQQGRGEQSLADHRCWATSGLCVCDCAEVIGADPSLKDAA